MEEQALSCPICTTMYDIKDHEPRFIPLCGHSLCLRCLNKILNESIESCKCPLCNKSCQLPNNDIALFPKNYAILDLVDTKVPREYCNIHKSQLELICFDCKCKICNRCVFKGIHKDHEVDLLENFNSDVEFKMKDLQEALAKNDSYFYAIENLINVKKENLLSQVDTAHNTYVKILAEKKDKVKKDIDYAFVNILKRKGLGLRKMLSDEMLNWKIHNSLTLGFKLKEDDLPKIKEQNNPTDSKALIEDAMNYYIKSEFEVAGEWENLILLKDKLEEIPEVSEEDKEKEKDKIVSETLNQHGYVGNVFYEAFNKDLKIVLNEQGTTLRGGVDPYVNIPNSGIDQCTIDLETAKVTKDNMDAILAIFWNIKSLKGLSVKLKGASITKDVISQLFYSAAIHFELQSLTLDFTECVGVNDETLGIITKILATLEEIKSLNLSFKSCLDITNNGLSRLTSALSQLTEIESLNLNIDGCYVIAATGFDTFTKSLLNLKNMVNLEVSCQKLSRLGDEGMISLSQAITTLKKLSQFDLSFAFGSIGDKGMTVLASNLRRLTGLKQLRLDLSQCDSVTDFGFTTLAQTLATLTDLKRLYLVFESTNNITDIGLLHLSNSFQRLKKLEILNFSFEHNTSITDQGVTHIGRSLGYLSSLNELYCYIGGCSSVGDEGLKDLMGSISSLKKLTSIGLSLNLCATITDSTISKLSISLLNLLDLKQLTLDLEGCHEIGYHSISQMFQTLATLPNFTNIEIYFKDCVKIDDECLEKVSFYLPLIGSLRDVLIQFDGCSSISDAGVVKFVQACSVATRLDRLNLSFMWCSQLSDESIEKIAVSVPQIISLEDLVLDFRMCPKITKVGIQTLFQQLPKGDKLAKKIFF